MDALNVFPVPDGDTGTNMSLTMSSAAQRLMAKDNLTLTEAAEMCSLVALMCARGNSGVILSQIFRGIAKSLSGKAEGSAMDLAQALDEAVATAYKAVMKPVEGTILTVLRAMRDAAVKQAQSDPTIEGVIKASVINGKEVLARTPEMLPVLKQAGVVDAGGKGLCFIFEGALASLTHSNTAEVIESTAYKNVEFDLTENEILKIDNPYDTQFLIVGEDLRANEIRERLDSLGDSLLVVGSPSLLRVHIHTKEPGEVLSLCLKYGSLSQVTIDNMIEQSRSLMSDDVVTVETGTQSEKEISIISVATGEGLKKIFASLGCDLVLDGGLTMNPSTSELVDAVKSVKAKKVIFLPNNANIFLAAKQAKKLIGRNVYIIPSKTVPQGISALLALNLNENMKHNLKKASQAIKRVRTGEVTFAARDGRFGKQRFSRGQIIGLIDGKVEATGEDPEVVLKTIVENIVKKDDEIVTIYYGSDVDSSRAEEVVQAISCSIEHVEVELHNGGQPLYYYIVSSE